MDSNLTLAYRPKQFSDIVGNEFVVKILQFSVLQNEISSAYFLSGTRGCGKTSAARVFSKAINCQNLSKEAEPCLKCASCISIDNDTNIDVKEMDCASSNSVEGIRKLNESCQYAPVQSKKRIFIMDEAHSLTTQAANALLKTLEEPPEHVVFIFCTTEPEKVIDTIKSRCLDLRFKNITSKDVVKRLLFIADKEKIKLEDKAAEFIASYAKGGLRDAISLLDQLSRHGVDVTLDFIKKCLSIVDEKEIFNILSLIAQRNSAEVVKVVFNIAFDKPILDFLSSFLEGIEKIYLFKLGVFKDEARDPTVERLALLFSRVQLMHLARVARKAGNESVGFSLLSTRSVLSFLAMEFCDSFEVKEVEAVSNQRVGERVLDFSVCFPKAKDMTEDVNFCRRFKLSESKV